MRQKRWPAGAKMTLRVEGLPRVSERSGRDYDVFDEMALLAPVLDGVFFEFQFAGSQSRAKFEVWDLPEVVEVEDRIRYDVEWEGFNIDIVRVSEVEVLPRSEPFVWSLHLYLREESEDN